MNNRVPLDPSVAALSRQGMPSQPISIFRWEKTDIVCPRLPLMNRVAQIPPKRGIFLPIGLSLVLAPVCPSSSDLMRFRSFPCRT